MHGMEKGKEGEAILLFAKPKDKGMLPPKVKAKKGMSDMPEMSDEEKPEECEYCEGEGCEHCDYKGYHEKDTEEEYSEESNGDMQKKMKVISKLVELLDK